MNKNFLKTYEVKGENVQLYDYEIQALVFLHHQKMVTAEQFLEHLVGFHKAKLDFKSYDKRLTYLWHSHLVEVGEIGERYVVLLSQEGESLLKRATDKAVMSYSAPLNTIEQINNHLHIQQIIIGYFNLVRNRFDHVYQPGLPERVRKEYLSLPLFVGGNLTFHPVWNSKLNIGQHWILGRKYNGNTKDKFIHFLVISNDQDADQFLEPYIELQEQNEHEDHNVIFIHFADIKAYDLKELDSYERNSYKKSIEQTIDMTFSQLIKKDLLPY
ncbi:hypothetical protein [Virgibacillus oceani]|uniref:Uncharacterized protein n=1 Tax=Virgibacillus oceani TaxID=1479511 RepID=A0A917LVJ4_9BACI|nr:hypothetical protein [Virgibacillus oceani]GGG61065.1 hypothetical protein GCM10011398_00400 [Virgibacillus oceani]